MEIFPTMNLGFLREDEGKYYPLDCVNESIIRERDNPTPVDYPLAINYSSFGLHENSLSIRVQFYPLLGGNATV